MERKFKNRENEEVQINGKTVWLSRSVAVVGVIVGKCRNENYVLVEKRSEIMDSPNKWAVVSGYLDWNESAYEAVKRETYEETGLDLDKLPAIFDNEKEPVYVMSDPNSDVRQNVTLGFLIIHDFPSFLPSDVELYVNKEVSEVRWLNVKELDANPTFHDSFNWAFGHDVRIRQMLSRFPQYFANHQ